MEFGEMKRNTSNWWYFGTEFEISGSKRIGDTKIDLSWSREVIEI